MASKPPGKENVHTAPSRFGWAAGRKQSTTTVVPLQDKDGAASADTDPYNLLKMAREAMPDDTEQYREVMGKLKQHKGEPKYGKSKYARSPSDALQVLCRPASFA